MNRFILVAWLAVVVAVNSAKLSKQIEAAIEKWDDYKEDYEKDYTGDDEQVYMEAFVKNVIHIDNHNRDHRLGRKTFEMGLNHIADLVGQISLIVARQAK